MKQNWSRRELEAFGEPLGDSVTQRKLGGGYICGGGGKGGGGGGTPPPQQSTAYQTNIPEYAKPYVTNMLEATQKQLFEGAPTAEGGFNITGFKPYRPYSTDVSNYFAPFSPMQRQAQQATAALQTPGEYQQAIGLTGLGAMGSMGLAGQGAAAAQQGFGAGQQYAQNVTSPGTMQAYMSPYQQSVTDVAKAAAVREAQMAQNAQNLGASRQGTYGGARQALMQGERERNLLSNLSNIQAQGSQSAYDRALQSQQFGANLGLQGLQAGYGGLGVGLQGLGQTMQGAGQLGQLGGAQLQAQQGIIGLQNQMGGQQQAMEQAKINQATQDYATQQQYPLLQLGMMSNMLRGLPMQATTTQTYQAAPAPITQGLGLLAGAAGAKQAGLFAEGGTIKELASGGVAGYANRGMVQANPDSGVVRGIRQKLMMMNADELNRVAQSSPSEEIRAMAIQILQEQKIREQAEAQAQQSIAQDQRGLPTPVTERAGLPAAPAGSMDMLNAASGGIVAFAGEDESLVEDETTRLQKDFANREAVAKFLAQRRQDANIGAPKAELAKFYAKQQADLAEDRKRKGGYDLINYSLELGTQPGGLLQAGLQAGKRVLPGMIAREDALRGRESDIAKGRAEIEQADRLERLGYAKEAAVMRNEALNRFSKKDIAIMESENRKAIAAKDTVLDKIFNDVFADLVKNQKMDPNNPNTRVIARRIAAGISGLTAEKVDVQKEAQVTRREKEDGELRQLEIEFMGTEPNSQERAAIQQKIAAARQRIRNEVYKTEPTAAPTAGGKGKLVEGSDGIQTYQPGA